MVQKRSGTRASLLCDLQPPKPARPPRPRIGGTCVSVLESCIMGYVVRYSRVRCPDADPASDGNLGSSTLVVSEPASQKVEGEGRESEREMERERDPPKSASRTYQRKSETLVLLVCACSNYATNRWSEGTIACTQLHTLHWEAGEGLARNKPREARAQSFSRKFLRRFGHPTT